MYSKGRTYWRPLNKEVNIYYFINGSMTYDYESIF